MPLQNRESHDVERSGEAAITNRACEGIPPIAAISLRFRLRSLAPASSAGVSPLKCIPNMIPSVVASIFDVRGGVIKAQSSPMPCGVGGVQSPMHFLIDWIMPHSPSEEIESDFVAVNSGIMEESVTTD